MKDKQQRIEEMARDIAKRDCHLYDKCPKPIKHNCVSQDPAVMLESSKHYVTIATWLVNANYQKVDENSVVLTKAEKQKLLHEMYEQGRFDALADLDKEGKVVLTKEEYDRLSYFAFKGRQFMRDDYEFLKAQREAIAILDEYNKALADIEAKTVRPFVISNGVDIKEN